MRVVEFSALAMLVQRQKMKRAMLALLILTPVFWPASAIPAVFITCTDIGNGVIELRYDFSEEETSVRGFALDITISDGVITTVGNLNPYYSIYPGDIYIDPDGEISDNSSPVCSTGTPGCLGGLGTSGISVEMGSLWVGETNIPPDTGVLFTFTITAECNVNVEGNALCGGVVMENPYETPIVYFSGGQVAPAPHSGQYAGGAGTPGDPFLISSAADLNSIGTKPAHWCTHFKLTADIDLSSYGPNEFNIIGTSLYAPFEGVFDGNGHKISNFTHISDTDYKGLFGCVDGADAQIINLDMINPIVDVGTADYAGPLVGYLNSGTVSRCSSQNGTVAGNGWVGGLIGRNFEGVIAECYSSTNVFANTSFGGLVGKSDAQVLNCYSSGNVSQYADFVGGFAGYNKGNILTSFCDEQTSGQTEAVGETGASAVSDVTSRPTTQMQTQATFANAGWDFKGEAVNGTEDIWTICEDKTYPRLVRKGFIGDFVGGDSVDLQDFAVLAAAWKTTPTHPNWSAACDISEPADATIDEDDLAVFAANWLTGAP